MGHLTGADAIVRLVGIDVDGTLVGASGGVDPRIWAAADRARLAGVRLALCSGRPAFGVACEYARRLDEGWHVFQNGASIVELATARSLSVSLPSDALQSLIAQARNTGCMLELYSDTEYVVEHASEWARQHAALLGVEFEPRPFESLQGDAVRAQWLVSSQRAMTMIAQAPAGLEIAQSTSPIMPETQFVGLTRAGVSKGTALRRIAAEYGIPLAHVMYVGDSGNDLDAMRIAGFPVAMGNAQANVQAAAKLIVPGVDEAGLARALEIAIEHAVHS